MSVHPMLRKLIPCDVGATLIRCAAFAAYGFLLGWYSLLLIGTGHGGGTLVIVLVSSPFGILLGFCVSTGCMMSVAPALFFFGTAAWWITAGFLLRRGPSKRVWLAFATTLGLHYLVALIILMRCPWVGWASFWDLIRQGGSGRSYLLGIISLFVVGQAAIWWRLFAVRPRPRPTRAVPTRQ